MLDADDHYALRQGAPLLLTHRIEGCATIPNDCLAPSTAGKCVQCRDVSPSDRSVGVARRSGSDHALAIFVPQRSFVELAGRKTAQLLHERRRSRALQSRKMFTAEISEGSRKRVVGHHAGFACTTASTFSPRSSSGTPMTGASATSCHLRNDWPASA